MSVEHEHSEIQSKSGAYVLEAGGAAELARLMRQDVVITKTMGGIFPEQPDLTHVHSLLDLACGPGGWTLEVAYKYSDIKVVGVDINAETIAYASAQAAASQCSNVEFQVMDILKPLAFPDASFDLVNARYMIAFMRPEQWPVLIKECLRVLRPGGILRFTEFECGGANKPALEKTYALLTLTMQRAGYTFSPGGYYLGLLAVLPRLFRDAQLQNVRHMAHAIEYSADTDIRDSYYYNLASAFQSVTSFVAKHGVATEAEWTALYQQGVGEMYQEDFCGMLLLLTVWGNKPG